MGGDDKGAAQQLQQALDADPDQQQENYYLALYYLGFAYYNAGDTAHADEVFQTVIEKYPNHASEVSPFLSGSGQGTAAAAPATGGSQGEASMSQDSITVYGGGAETQTTPAYNPADVAWTDPTTGLHYDMYGNLLG